MKMIGTLRMKEMGTQRKETKEWERKEDPLPKWEERKGIEKISLWVPGFY